MTSATKGWVHGKRKNPPMWQLFESEVAYFSQQYHSFLRLQHTMPASECNAHELMFHGVFPEEKKIELCRDGYTILRQVVPLDVIEEAVSFIDSHIEASVRSKVGGNTTADAASSLDCQSTSRSGDVDSLQSKSISTSTSSTAHFSSAHEQRLEQKENVRLQRAVEREKQQPARRDGGQKNGTQGPSTATSVHSNDKIVLALLYGTPVHRLLLSILYGDAVLAAITNPLIPSANDQQGSAVERLKAKTNSLDTETPTSKSEMNSLAAKGIASKFPHVRDGLKTERVLLNHLPKQCQLAYRYPKTSRGSSDHKEDRRDFVGSVRTGAGNWHLDGMLEGKRHPFTLLVGVALSDQTADFSGNLCVFPGTHTDNVLQKWLKTFTAAKAAEEGGRNGRTDDEGKKDIDQILMAELGGKPILDKAIQVKLQKGDVVLVVQRLAHYGGPNISQNTRKMAYFRAQHVMIDEVTEMQAAQSVEEEDIWVDLEGASL